MQAETLGQRMKEYYEFRSQTHLTRRMPVIIRIDGRAFHTLTKKLDCQKPFDKHLRRWMVATTRALCENIQGAKTAYTQSDEISILVTDYDRLTSDAWFDYNVQKMTSVSASIATATFLQQMIEWQSGHDSHMMAVNFDSRVFNLPKEEVNNYFIWRQQDWIKNSISMLARAYYSHKELHGKKQSDMHEMLYQKGVNWAELDDEWKNGTTLDYQVFDTSEGGPEPIIRSNWDEDPTHIFSEYPEYINRLVGLEASK